MNDTHGHFQEAQNFINDSVLGKQYYQFIQEKEVKMKDWLEEAQVKLNNVQISRGGHTGLFLEIPYETPESGGLLNVEKDRKKIGYPCLKEK